MKSGKSGENLVLSETLCAVPCLANSRHLVPFRATKREGAGGHAYLSTLKIHSEGDLSVGRPVGQSVGRPVGLSSARLVGRFWVLFFIDSYGKKGDFILHFTK